uniref:C2H2-type domain-containing protein n=1 Tax=Clastoptera arizonana TaxID=38151 RepID=A0A1B6BZW9_9HEMI
MNFTPFGGHFPTSIPVHQFSAAKFNHDANGGVNGLNPQVVGGMNNEPMVSSANRYSGHFSNQHPISTMPIKYQRDNSTQLSGNMLPMSSPPPAKYPSENVHHYSTNVYNTAQQHPPQQRQDTNKRPYHTEGNIHQQNVIKREEKDDRNVSQNGEYSNVVQQHQQPGMPPSWQSIATPGSTVADYLSHLPASTLPLSLHHFLKYSAETIGLKKEVETSVENTTNNHHHQPQQQTSGLQLPAKKKKKKKVNKEKKPRPKPGEIRLTTALDGSTLYCCPECHMAYPDKNLLEQHLLGHTMERRFFCDICGAGLKRKDHLTRHKQSHNPDRPFVCTVCMKAFKRKEQLTLHFVIHSGEKRHICPECGKGFYRKDHLRKHTRSHIARRVKAELSQHVPTNQQNNDRDPLS